MTTELSQENADLSCDAVGVSLCRAFAEEGRQLVGAGLFFPGGGRHVVSFVVGRGHSLMLVTSLVGVDAEVDLCAVGEQERDGAAE
jgi:hypothetical protein